jgi:hypothetical protein
MECMVSHSVFSYKTTIAFGAGTQHLWLRHRAVLSSTDLRKLAKNSDLNCTNTAAFSSTQI